jgi:pimeloyl-ACP methyl ester carboxylesterase
MQPDLVRSLVLSPPLPGAGDRVLTAKAQSEFWYQAFHQLPLAGQLIDGNPDLLRDYLRHFWTHWSGPNFVVSEDDLERLVSDYGLPGSFTASIAWYRAGAGMIAQSLTELPPERAIKIHVPTDVVWPHHDPLFPAEWSDRLGHYFTEVQLHFAFDAGHFTPLECPEQFAELILVHARPTPAAD